MAGQGSSASSPFGRLLRHHRQASGLSQEKLAERAGLSARAISDIERGLTLRPYWHSVAALAGALGLQDEDRDEFARAARSGSKPADPGADASLVQSGDRSERSAGAGQSGVAAGARLLPAAVSHFTGRAEELEALSALLSQTRGKQTVMICALAGMAGVGKTALAVRWARQVVHLFPDGQLYVNLRGYDPDQPVSAADALAGFLRALGVPGQQIPDGVDERAGLYRSRLVGQRMLVLLDNARDGEQVRPLLPGDPGCVVIVTSRDALAGLVATDGARRMDLDLLPPHDAVTLLRVLIGRRAEENPPAIAEMARQCARLPLALRIAAELAAARPEAPLADLVTELAAAQLDQLDAGEQRADVRAVFSWSVRHLPDDAAEAFALVGLHPGADLDAHAAAALTGTTTAETSRVLGQLHRASLIQAAGPNRYGMHDLLRAYAREQATAGDRSGQAGQALTRLFDYYLAAATAAMNVAFPAEADRRPVVAGTTLVLPEVPGEAEARAWLDAERANLTAVVTHCAGHGWPQHATKLAGALYKYLLDSSYLPEAEVIYRHSAQAARRSGDLVAEGKALNGLGSICTVKGRGHDAVGYYRAALDAYRGCGNQLVQAQVLGNLAITEHDLRNYPASVAYFRQAEAIYEDAGDQSGVARVLALLAGPEIELGSYDDADSHLRRALPALAETGDTAYEGCALGLMGQLNLSRSQPSEAAKYFTRAITVCRRVNYRAGAANGLRGLGQVSLYQADWQQAIAHLRQAIDLYQEAGDRLGETLALRNLATALRQAGQPAASHAELQAALQLAAETGNTYQQASIHSELADHHDAIGQAEQARPHWQRAMHLYTQLGAPEADKARSRLHALQTAAHHYAPQPAQVYAQEAHGTDGDERSSQTQAGPTD